MAGRFAADVTKWAAQSEERLAAVWHASLRGLDKEIADNTPVLTGNLRNSRTVSTTGPVAIDWRTKKFRKPEDAINNAIAGAEVGGIAHLGFRAPYAWKNEKRTGFLRLVAQRWGSIVNDAVRRVKGGV